MKKLISLSFLVFAIVFTSNVNAQKLDKFGADMGKKVVMNKDLRVPYTDVLSYFGYIKPGSTPDEVRGGKNYYYLYIWIPAAAPELGVRMISPVPDKMVPEKTDFVATDFTPNVSDKTNYFDTWVSLEKAAGVNVVADLAKAKTAKWNLFDSNDDSSEMPAQPSGSNYNSLMRITSNVSDPLKSLVAGVYRIGFTTYKVGDVNGSFLAQIGSPIKLPGVKIAQTIDELIKATAETK